MKWIRFDNVMMEWRHESMKMMSIEMGVMNNSQVITKQH
jgi:hypothetical protein